MPLRLLLCMCAFMLCILVTVAPLNRLAGTTEFFSLPVSMFLTVIGTKLPTDLHLTSNVHASQINTDVIEFLAVMMLVYLFYFLSAYGVHRYSKAQEVSKFRDNTVRSTRFLIRCIWMIALLASVVYVLAPSTLSHDYAVYAGYGRIIVLYHANPYYTPLSAFPADFFFRLDDWRDAVAAYGPLWLLVCAISALVAGNSVLHSIFFYRILNLLAHLLNIWLVTTILRETKHSPRLIVLGTLLYAWNPLVLLESGLGGHNDIVMVACILVGVLLSIRAEQHEFKQARYYLPPALVFTSAALIKFTAAPLLLFYLVLIARRIFVCEQVPEQQTQTSRKYKWNATLRAVSITALISAFLALVLYIPLWLGHSLHDIGTSLSSPPSSRLAFGSILLALRRISPAEQNGLLALLSLHSTWNAINALVVGVFLCLGATWLYRTPTTLTMVQATLALLGALLIVTPWFFPWYVLWLVGLAALCVATSGNLVKRALVGSTLIFSASALFIYLFRGYPPIGDWGGLTSLTTIGPPLIALLYLLFARKIARRTPSPLSMPVENSANQPAP